MPEPMKIIFLFFCFWNISVYGQEERYCASEVLNGLTFRARCRFNGIETPCDGKIQPNTRVIITCSFGYKRPLRAISEIIRCTETGEWDYLPVSCEPECGKITGSTPLISGEVDSNASNVPWNAIIYANSSGKYEQICGGTIYSAKLVISVAHCFWDESHREIKSIDLYQVGVGKFYRSYDSIESRLTQFFNISEIYIPKSFNGQIGSYQNDIAILILSDFITYKYNIKPICIKWLQPAEQDVQPGTRGHIAAWGIIFLNKRATNKLRVFDQETYSNEECLEKYPSSESVITSERFCVGYPKDEAVDPDYLICKGDTGGGYVIANNDRGTPTHYLLGVLNFGLGRECKSDQLTLFTNVQHYKDMITDFEIKYKPK